MPEITDIERRLRETEQELAEHRGDVKRLLSDVTSIVAKMDTIAAAAVRFGQVDTEQTLCRAKCDAQNSVVLDFAGRLSKVESKVESVVKSESETKGWWGRRFEKLVDTAAPLAIGAILLLIVGQYTGVSVKHVDSDDERFAKIEAAITRIAAQQTPPAPPVAAGR